MIVIQVAQQEGTKAVVSNATDHGNRGSLTSSGHGLIGALAAGDDGQIFAAEGLAGRRETRRAHDQVGVQTPDDEDIRHDTN